MHRLSIAPAQGKRIQNPVELPVNYRIILTAIGVWLVRRGSSSVLHAAQSTSRAPSPLRGLPFPVPTQTNTDETCVWQNISKVLASDCGHGLHCPSPQTWTPEGGNEDFGPPCLLSA